MRIRLLILDNYDSFTYNLAHTVAEVAEYVHIDVCRNDRIALSQALSYDAIILSPGPGLPADAGIMPQLLRTELGNMPILGVCLGLQAIGEAYGYKLKNLPQVYHGVQHSLLVTDRRDPLLGGLPDNFLAGRYHSWVVDGQYIPPNAALRVSCIDAQGEIMAMYDPLRPVFGVQFHPESVMTPLGHCIIKQFIDIALGGR
jgi:anthranilate synthase component 2